MDNELVRIEKLKGVDNWGMWKFQVRILIQASDAFEVVTGEHMKPVLAQNADAPARTEYEKKAKVWKKLDNIAQKIIVTTVAEQPLLHILNCQSSKEMWDKLNEIFENKSETSKHILQQQWYTLNRDAADDIATHIAKIKDLAHRLSILGEPVSDSMIMTKILMTLPSSYQYFHTAWESTSQEQRTLSNLTARLTMEELRANVHDDQGNSAFSMKSKQKHTAKGSHVERKTGKLPGKCYNCGKPGHWKRDCRSKPVNTKSSGDRGGAFVGQIVTATALTSGVHSEDWFLDSGASEHMSPARERFVNYQKLLSPIQVRVGNGTLIPALGKGEIDIVSYNGEAWQRNYLAGVLYVPGLKYNLFSLSSALDKGLQLVSDDKKCELKKNGNTVAVGARYENLYRMAFKPYVQANEVSAQARTQSERTDSLKQWHERLAHQNTTQVKNILKQWGIEVKSEQDWFCEGCNQGKMRRKSFQTSQSQTLEPGELVHADLCGPMEHLSVGKSRYFLLFKDDYSHYRTVYFLKQKSEVTNLFQFFLKSVETELGRKVKRVRTDNGLEFVNKDMQDIMLKNGIKHEKSTPYNPEQNGSIERENRTVVEAARSMIYAKGMNLELWAEAVHHANYVLNRTGTSSVRGKTPHELWFKKPPTTIEFKVFGTEVYAHVPKQKRRKWSPKSKKGVFVGYDDCTKGYRVWFPSEHKVETHRDVVFQPESFGTTEEYKNDIMSRVPNSIQDQDLEENNYDEHEDQEPEAEPGRPQENVQERQADQQENEERRDGNRQLRDRQAIRRPIRYGEDYILDLEETFLAKSQDPITFESAIKGDEADKWRKAMIEEMESLERNQTWELVKPPANAKILQNRWVYRYKPAAKGKSGRYKARLVVKGFTQRAGIDYEETFSPVVKFGSIRSILTVAAAMGMKLAQFDIKTAYLNGDLTEEIYMVQPKGHEDGSGRVCKLQKALYGLKQSARCWNKKFTRVLEEFNLKTSEADPCVFTAHENNEELILAVYIDDGLIASTSEKKIDELLQFLARELEVTVMPLNLFLGMEIEHLSDGSIFVQQSSYAQKVLNRFRMEEAHAVAIPADFHQELSLQNVDKKEEAINVPYKEAVGSLLYLAMVTRPDIAYAVHAVSQYAESPQKIHWNAVKRIMKYIKGTVNHGILFPKGDQMLSITAYSDADFAGDKTTRKSTSGTIIKVGDAPVVWSSQKQRSVALSTTESEYIAASQTTKELIWVRRLMNDLVKCKVQTPTMYVDNQSAIKLVKNPEFHKRTKHIDVRYHFIRQHYEEKVFELRYIHTDEQIADICTKPLSKARFEYLREKLSLVNRKDIVENTHK